MAIMSDPKLISEFILAGHATFTIKSQATGEHYTYQLNKADNGDCWFLSVRTGDTFAYVGTMFERLGFLRLTKKSRFTSDSTCVRAFKYFRAHLYAGQLAPKLEFRHEGACGRCGRPLTRPDSIDRGLGPICAHAMATGSDEVDGDEPEHNLLLAG